MKNINYKLVNTAGQITSVVFGVSKRYQYSSISNSLMNSDTRIEQVVFIEKDRIQTMGDELCINGSLAGAYLLRQPKLEISGIDQSALFTQKDDSIAIRLPIDILQFKRRNVIKLKGIVYLVSNNKRNANKKYLSKLACKFSVPASGIIFYKKNSIRPLVYVTETDSLVWENACGSGSLSYFIYSGISKIIQPSNKIVLVNKSKIYFTVKVQAKIVSDA